MRVFIFCIAREENTIQANWRRERKQCSYHWKIQLCPNSGNAWSSISNNIKTQMLLLLSELLLPEGFNHATFLLRDFLAAPCWNHLKNSISKHIFESQRKYQSHRPGFGHMLFLNCYVPCGWNLLIGSAHRRTDLAQLKLGEAHRQEFQEGRKNSWRTELTAVHYWASLQK